VRCTTLKIFQWADLPLASTALYILRQSLYDSSRSKFSRSLKRFSSPPGAVAAHALRHSETRMKPKRTILCVDDNEQALSIRKVMLETRGYRVVTCISGEEALECFKRGGVDLVLTDLIMPGLDGSKLIDAVKNISPQTPAILLSGKVRIYDRDTRADVFLPKGMYAPAELLERIRLLLVRKRGPKRAPQRAERATATSAA
jgi:two-component system response regulator CpxR